MGITFTIITRNDEVWLQVEGFKNMFLITKHHHHVINPPIRVVRESECVWKWKDRGYNFSRQYCLLLERAYRECLERVIADEG